MDVKDKDVFLRKLLKGRELYTATDLVKMGLYGSVNTVYRGVREGNLEGFWVTNNRLVIVRESIIQNILSSKKNSLP